MVTVVINSCGRLPLLKQAVTSFHQYNTFPIKEMIIVDDSGDPEIHEKLKTDYPTCTLVLEKHRGLIPCIDDGFSRADSEYIFKMEDDWLFYRYSFIEKSMKIMEVNPSIINVWLRERNDTNGHPIDGGHLCYAKGVHYSLISTNYLNGEWHGFTFNPSLWRKSDYERLAPFSAICGSGHMATQEMNIGQWYYRFGYRAAIMTEGFVRHIGVYPGKYIV